MSSKPKYKRGHAPGSIEHRWKDKSGNILGRPRKAVPEAEETDLATIIARVADTPVPVQNGEVVREVRFKEALVQVLASSALKNTRDGFRMLRLMLELGGGSLAPKLTSDDQPAKLLDDPVVKRHLEREIRRRLRQQGQDEPAAELMQNQFGPEDDEAGERDAAVDPTADTEP